MTIRFAIPGPLRPMTGGHSEVHIQAAGSNLSNALDALFAAHPGVRDRILTEQGDVREHVNVFVGTRESRTTGGLATPIADGAEISIIPAISGG